MTTNKSALKLLALSFTLATVSIYSENLDDLLDDGSAPKALAESDNFQTTWNTMLDELSKREYPKADSALKTLEAERGFVSPQRRDFIRLAGRVVRFKESLEEDKAIFRADFQQMTDGVNEAAQAIKALQLEYSAMLKRNKASNSLPPAVQANMDKRYNELVALLGERRKAQEAMKAEALNFETARIARLESEITEWIKKDDTEEDVVTGLILSSAYLDQVGDSEKVRAQSQVLSAQQEELSKTEKIVNAIASEIEPLAAQGKGEEAQTRLETMIAKVETSNQSDFVKKATVAKLRVLGLKIASAKNVEKREKEIAAQTELEAMAVASANTAELNERLDILENKLDAAQATFGTVIRSIEGFSEYTADFKGESDREKMAASLKEKLKSGVISKEKIDNMVKAKAEHIGIMREVEILQSDSSKLSAVQKGRLANLHATAETALELLKQVTQ
jgi:tetrahydromethanopterin S-methyltransferase subunit G